MLDEDDGSRLPPLRDCELGVAQEKLLAWLSPSDFQAAVQALHRRVNSRAIFNNPRLKFLLDGWILTEFALRKMSVDCVRLASPKDQWPDGYIRTESTVKNIEVTTALMPGRKMGEEYKFDTGIQFDPIEDWIARADAIPETLESAIRKKAAKHYGSDAWLVVYLNLDEYGVRQQQTELLIAQVKQRHARAFEAIFVLWKDKLY